MGGQYKTYMSLRDFYEMEYPIHMYYLAMYNIENNDAFITRALIQYKDVLPV